MGVHLTEPAVSQPYLERMRRADIRLVDDGLLVCRLPLVDDRSPRSGQAFLPQIMIAGR